MERLLLKVVPRDDQIWHAFRHTLGEMAHLYIGAVCSVGDNRNRVIDKCLIARPFVAVLLDNSIWPDFCYIYIL